jgi:hypothetical protein
VVAAFGDTATHDLAFVAEPLLGAAQGDQGDVELGEVTTADVAQLAAFQVIPDPVHWMESGCIPR